MDKMPNLMDGKSLMEAHKRENKSKELAVRLELTVNMLTVTSAIVLSAFMLLESVRKSMFLLLMALFIIPLILYIKYNDVLSLSDRKRKTDQTKGRKKVIFALLAPCFGLIIRTVLDFNLASLDMFLIWSTGLTLILLLVFLVFTKEYRMDKTAILVILLVTLAFAPATVVQVNKIFDSSEPQYTYSTIQAKEIIKSKTEKNYYIKATIASGKVKSLKVSRIYFENLSIGDKVTISERSGLLKIPYVQVKE